MKLYITQVDAYNIFMSFQDIFTLFIFIANPLKSVLDAKRCTPLSGE